VEQQGWAVACAGGHSAGIGTRVRLEGAPNISSATARALAGSIPAPFRRWRTSLSAWARSAKRRWAGTNNSWRLSANIVAARTVCEPR
jgi:hypothetical protein